MIVINSFQTRYLPREAEAAFDTLTQNDLVTQQYASLPYPPFGEEEIMKEEIHYETNSNADIKVGFTDITLENINHFLFSGSESFR